MKAATFFVCCVIGSIVYLTFSYYYLTEDESKYPILLWWTDFVLEQETITCNKSRKCVVSGNLEHLNHNNLEAVIFYGSLLDLENMPKHNPNIYWALFHEESPKNQPALRSLKLQQMFNITSTFSRHSTFPITLQYLESLEALTSLEFFVDVQVKNKLIKYREHAPILYIQSACDTPIKRDDYVKELMKYFKVDSYGACLNNKQMPRELMSETGTIEFYSEKLLELNSRYKFIIAIENAKCEDYITEKFWRPLIVGAIPIYLGATTIKDYLPNEKSAILMDDFHSIAALAAYITKVNNDDNLYNSYMNHKLRNQITNERLLTLFKHGGSLGQANYYYDVIPSFQCFICDAVYDKLVIDQNEKNVYDCQYPEDKTWHYSWKLGEENAERFL